MDHLSPGVKGQPGQHSETKSQIIIITTTTTSWSLSLAVHTCNPGGLQILGQPGLLGEPPSEKEKNPNRELYNVITKP